MVKSAKRTSQHLLSGSRDELFIAQEELEGHMPKSRNVHYITVDSKTIYSGVAFVEAFH